MRKFVELSLRRGSAALPEVHGEYLAAEKQRDLVARKGLLAFRLRVEPEVRPRRQQGKQIARLRFEARLRFLHINGYALRRGKRGVPCLAFELDGRDSDLFVEFERPSASGFKLGFGSENVKFTVEQSAVEIGDFGWIRSRRLHQRLKCVDGLKHGSSSPSSPSPLGRSIVQHAVNRIARNAKSPSGLANVVACLGVGRQHLCAMPAL